MKYSDIKKEIYGYYNHMGNIDNDNIIDVNDHIVGEHLGNNRFEEFLSELYITISMCTYMIEKDLYDEYFFESYKELIDEFNKSKNMFNNLENEFQDDVSNIDEYIKKDEIKKQYYDELSNIYKNAKKDKTN